MFWSAGSFWILLCNYIFYIFGFIIRYIFRFDGYENSGKIDSGCSVEESEPDGFGEKEKSELKSEDFNESNGETECSVFMETASTANTQKYQFMSVKDISGFMEEPEPMSFTVHGLFVGSDDDSFSNNPIHDSRCFIDKDFRELNLEAVAVNQEKTEDSAVNQEKTEDSAVNQDKTDDSAESFSSEEVLEKQREGRSTGHELSEKGEVDGLENNYLENHDFPDEVQLLSENYFFSSDSEPGSISDGMAISTQEVDSINDEILSERKIGEVSEQETCITTDEKKAELREEIPCLAEIHLCDASISDPEAVLEDDYIELEPHSSVFNAEILSGQDFGKAEGKHEPPKDLDREQPQQMDNSEESEEPSLPEKPTVSDSDDQMDNSEESEEPSLQEKPSVLWDSDDAMECEFLQEHEDLIQQLKMELKNVKTRGLPTILEELESPKVAEDLKPLKIDDKKLEYKDRMEEIQNFYKSYAEKMRKLDILNNQTMHAIGLLRLKDPVQFNSTRKSSVPAIKSLLSWNLKTSKVGNHEADPKQKFIRELHRDLEMVYVGQVCLSWEILYWQYGKAQELQDCDSYATRQYNQVADAYQQFQVLVRRFIENEPFQGPRIQNYVENRCVLRNHLLQVPVIRDDCLKDKGKKAEDEYVISSAMLAEIIEESMRIFWEFLHADKDEANLISRGHQGTQVDLVDPADLELLMEIRTNLQKKEKKVKDLLRSRNCIVKSFQKPQEFQLIRALLFAQVEMKLVSRVLSMSRLTTEQLVWCLKKLNQIRFVNSKIHMEPSFLLFPC